MVNPEEKSSLKQDALEQVVETLLASIYKQKDMLNYLALVENKKLLQFDKRSASFLDFKLMSQSVGGTLEKINLYQTLVTKKFKMSSTLLHEPNNNDHCCCNHCANQSDGKNYYGYWGRH